MLDQPEIIVDDVRDVSPPAEVSGLEGQRLTITFAAGRTGMLDLAEPRSAVWADVLNSLRERGEPAYVRLDPNGVITELLLPVRYTVGKLDPVSDGIEVELVISHARHYLRASHPRFDEFLSVLESARGHSAPVRVTETLDTHEIIDVREG